MNNWIQIKDGDKDGFEIFSRHYTFRRWRQRSGRNATRFAGIGEQMILLSKCKKALFVWRVEKYRRDKQIGVCCAVFRNENDDLLSSDLIKEAVSLAQQRWPGERLFTFVNAKKIKSTNPGCCFKEAGWKYCGQTSERNLHIFEFINNEKTANKNS